MTDVEQDFETVAGFLGYYHKASPTEAAYADAALSRIRTALADAEQMVVGNALWVEVREQNRALRTEVERLREVLARVRALDLPGPVAASDAEVLDRVVEFARQALQPVVTEDPGKARILHSEGFEVRSSFDTQGKGETDG